MLAQEIPRGFHPRNIFEFDGHQHPEGAGKHDLVAQDALQTFVGGGGEGGQDRQSRTCRRRLLLGQDAGAAQRDSARLANFIEVKQLLTVEQIVDIADEAVLTQIIEAGDRGVLLQVLGAGVELEYVVGQARDDVRAAFRPLQGDHDIGFAP
ncbi:hypothetical protein D9M70_297760 [compost metagenome]